MTGRGFFVFGHHILNAVKQVLRHDGRDHIGNDDVFIAVFTDIAAIVQHSLYAARLDFTAEGISDAVFLEKSGNLFHG